MPNVYLISAVHWSVPAMLKSVAFTQAGADAAALVLVNNLREDSADHHDAPLPALASGADWREGLRELQRARIEFIGEGDKIDTLSGITGDADAALTDLSECWVEIEQLSCSEPLRAAIVLEGGSVSAVLSDIALDVTSIDYDVEGIDHITDATYDIPQDGGGTAEAFRSTFAAEINPARIDAINGAAFSLGDGLCPDQQCERWIYARVGPYGVSSYHSEHADKRRRGCSLYSATFADRDGAITQASFMLPGDDSLGDRYEIARRAIDAVYGPVTKLSASLRGPVAS